MIPERSWAYVRCALKMRWLLPNNTFRSPDYAVELSRLLPRCQLAVLPSTDHCTLVERSDWLLSMIAAFLDALMPEAK